jgi:hypothetical protein
MTEIRFLADESCDYLEDKDFGEWVFAHGEKIAGVILIRFPGNTRKRLGKEIINLVDDHGNELNKVFTVLEPGRARLRKI